MDLNDFIENGAPVKNPNYKKPSKSNPAGSPRFLVSDNIEDAYDNGTRIGKMLAEQSYDLTYLNNAENKYEDYGVHINPINTEEELQKERATNQAWGEQLGNAVVQAVGNEIVLGTALGLSNLVDAAINFTAEKGENDYTNPVSQFLEEKQNEIRNRFAIYQEDPNATWALGDFGWWANNSVSIASTASMLIPSTLVVKGLGLAGKVANIGNKVSRGMAKAYRGISGSTRSVNRLAKSISVGTEIGGSAFLSRTMENYLEARGVYTDTYDSTFNEIKKMSPEEKQKMIERNPQLAGKTDEEMAQYIAGASADKTFINDYAMLLMDVAQFKAIGSLWKGIAKKTPTAKLRTENQAAIKSLAGEAADDATKVASKSPWLTNRVNRIKEAMKHPLTTAGAIEWSEGFEEAYQGIQTEKGKEVAKMILDPEYTPRTIDSYITDPEIWEQAFWGVLGGVGFQAAGKALGNAYRKISAKRKKDKLSDEDFAANMTAEEKIRAAEIRGRAAKNKDFIDKMNLLNNLKNPYDYKKDPVTGERIKEDGVDVHKAITPEEAEIMKAELVNDYISSMTMKAVDAGNYELLRDYVSSPEFERYFKEAGVEITAADQQFNQQLLGKMEDVYNTYSDALYNILRNTEVDNESVAKIAAREITREQLAVNELTERRDLLEDKINELNTADSTLIDNYRRKAITNYAKKQLAQIDKMEQAMYEDYRNHNITEQAKNQYERDYNHRRKSLIKFLNDNNPFEGDIAKEIQLTYNSMGFNDDQYVLSKINKIINAIESLITGEDTGSLPKAVTELIDKQIGVEDALSYTEFNLPKTQEDFVERVSDTEQQVDKLAKKRLDDAAKKVEDYIIKQENLQKALEDVVAGNVAELKEANDILKLGYYSTDGWYKSILATIREEANKRAKEEKKKQEAVVDGTKQSPEKSSQIRNDIDAIESKGQAANNSPSTGGVQQTQGQNQQQGQQLTKQPQQSAGTNAGQQDAGRFAQQEASQAALTKEDVEEFDKAAAKEAINLGADLEPDADDMAVSRASNEAFTIFRTSRNLFDDALGKDMNSEEVQKIVDMITDILINNGVSTGFAPVAARRGLKVALGTMARRFEKRDASKAEQFRQLADSIAVKQDLRKDMAATTTTASIEEFNKLIDNFLDSYVKLLGITEIKGQKTIINLERLFNEIVNNPDIGIDMNTAFYILYNMKDYIRDTDDFGGKYIFTKRRELNAMLKNPAEFANAIAAANAKEVQLDNYMHISASSSKGPDYKYIIDKLRNGDDVEVEYSAYNRNGQPTSIRFTVDGKEIGFIAPVYPGKDNNTYSSLIGKGGGINYIVTKNGDIYTSNTDELFNAIFDENGRLWDLINKQYRHNINGANKGLTAKEAEEFMKHPAIKKAIAEGVIVKKEVWDATDKKYKDAHNTDLERAQFIIYKLQNIIFYNTFAQTMGEYESSYRQWIENVFTNYQNTHKIQTQLDKEGKIRTKFAGLAAAYGRANESANVLIDDTEHPIDEVGLTYDRNPIVGIVRTDDGVMAINEGTGKTISTMSPFMEGTMGMLIGGRETTPILALFTSANKISKYHKEALKKELTDILTGFQTGKYTFEQVDKKLSALFNGAGIKLPTIFRGYSVVHSGSRIALQVGGKEHSYNLVINKFKYESSEVGTGITYAPNGDIEKSKSTISVDNKFIEAIINEIADNVVYNRTFYTLNNLDKDNTTDNPYMYKENGKFIVELGGEKTVYENFGDFVLKEKAFNTNQGRNKTGGYFDNTDKVNSLYVDVSVVEEATPPVERQQSIADTIRTASEDKFNDTKDILSKAGFNDATINFFLGNNDYKIPLIPTQYGYDSRLTKEYAVYRNGKIYFGNAGANEANRSPRTLRRLLIHETLHGKFDEKKLFERENLVDELFDTYRAVVETYEDIIKNGNPDSDDYKNAVLVRDWIELNKFNPTDYFTKFTAEKNTEYAAMSEDERRRIFAEEWLVESLTQPLIMNFMNTHEYLVDGKRVEVQVEGIANEKKSIWQKIIDLLLKLFGKGRTNVKNNTIFAQQYYILGNQDTTVKDTVDAKNNNTVGDKDAGVDTTKKEQGASVNSPTDQQSTIKSEPTDDDPDWDNPDATDDTPVEQPKRKINLRRNRERLAATTTADEYVIDHVANDGDATAETFGITRITNMADYMSMFAEQDKPIIAKMLDNGEIKYACR